MLRQHQAAFPQELRPVDDRVHQDVLAFFEPFGLFPGEDPVLRKRLAVVHDFAVGSPFLIVNKITDEQIDRLVFRSIPELAERVQNALICARLYLVITVHYLKIQSCRILESRIDGASMSLVGLMDRLHDPGIFVLEHVCDLGCPVNGTVIYDKDLHFVSAY